MSLTLHNNFIWFITAIGIGIFVATQSLIVAAGSLALMAFFIVYSITPYTAFIVLAILAPIRALFTTESPLPVDIGQISVVALIFAWVVHKITSKRALLTSLRWSPIYTPLLVFIAVTGITAFNAYSLGFWLSEWLKWVFALALVVIIVDSIHDQHWEWLMFGIIVAGIANALVGIYIFFGGSGADHLLINDRFFRAFGTFGQPNPFGGFMGMLTPLAGMMAIGYLQVTLTRWRRAQKISLSLVLPLLFYTVSTGLLALGIVMSWSRGAWLSFVLSMLVVISLIPRRGWQRTILVMIVGLSGLVIWTSGLLPATIVDRVNSATEEFFAFDDVRAVDITTANYAVVERLAHWQAAINMAEDNFWWGVGFGNYEVAYDDYRLLNWREPLGHAHNYYLNVFAEAGIMGLISFVALWLTMFWLTWRTLKHPDIIARSAVIGMIGTWVYLSTHSLTDNLYVNNIFLHLGIIFGILAVLHRQTWQHKE